MSRRSIQLQQKPTRYVLASRRRGEVVVRSVETVPRRSKDLFSENIICSFVLPSGSKGARTSRSAAQQSRSPVPGAGGSRYYRWLENEVKPMLE